MHLKSEDFPAPFVPRITKQEFLLAWKLTLFTASLLSKQLDYVLFTLNA